jgi:hypothetical protein
MYFTIPHVLIFYYLLLVSIPGEKILVWIRQMKVKHDRRLSTQLEGNTEAFSIPYEIAEGVKFSLGFQDLDIPNSNRNPILPAARAFFLLFNCNQEKYCKSNTYICIKS